MKSTCHSEYGNIQRIYLMSCARSFISQEKISDEWKDLNYLGEPDYDASLKEYRSFEAMISKTGAEMIYFKGGENLSMDSLYCRDASVVTDFGIILCRMGKKKREREPPSAETDYLNHHDKILGKIVAPGTLEGGDVLWLDEKTLVVGHGYRTNHAGIAQLKDYVEPHGIEVVVVSLPHYKGPEDVFHLMSIISPVDKSKAVVYSPLMPVTFRNALLERAYELIEVPDEEFASLGCNVLALGPSEALMVAGNPITKERLERASVQVLEYRGEEISLQGGGGPTCLTRPVQRLV